MRRNCGLLVVARAQLLACCLGQICHARSFLSLDVSCRRQRHCRPNCRHAAAWALNDLATIAHCDRVSHDRPCDQIYPSHQKTAIQGCRSSSGPTNSMIHHLWVWLVRLAATDAVRTLSSHRSEIQHPQIQFGCCWNYFLLSDPARHRGDRALPRVAAELNFVFDRLGDRARHCRHPGGHDPRRHDASAVVAAGIGAAARPPSLAARNDYHLRGRHDHRARSPDRRT